MNVLSLFDGMSCGQLALDRLGIKVDVYLAAEIDKYAMSIAKKNYPNTIHLGDVTTLRGMDLPKIDLLMGGSPCQGFSFAGKQLNFDDPRSALFFEFVRLLEETKPKYFLLENVRMKQEYQDVISEHLGVKPIMINSALLSAQNRVRLYWTNIPNIEQPEDKGIVLKDILEDGVDDSFAQHRVDKFESTMKENPKISKKGIKQLNSPSFSQHRVYGIDGKSPTLNTCGGGGNTHAKVLIKPIRVGNIKGGGQGDRVYSTDGKGISLSAQSGGTAGNGNMLIVKDKIDNNPSATKKGKAYALTHSYTGAVAWNSIERKQRTMVPVCQSDEVDPNIVDGFYYRKLTPVECERLQTVPDNYTEGVSNTQRYKMLGNGWTVDVIKHIFKGMK